MEDASLLFEQEGCAMLTMARYRRQFILTLLICIAAVSTGCADDSPMVDTEENLTTITADDLTEERNLEVNSPALGSIPEDYYQETGQGGTLETFSYECAAGSKNVTVYLPYGYDEADSETKYDILYLMHGAGGNETTYLGSSEQPTELKNILDQMIARQDIKPMIVVCPALNLQGSLFDNDEDGFCEEWRQSIVPAVESAYHTYAETTTPAGFRASRSHRAFGGFSMGGAATWFTFAHEMDYFAYFLPMSGDYWIDGALTGGSDPEKTARELNRIAKDSGYGTQEYFIFAATGTADIAYTPEYNNMGEQIEAMKGQEAFDYTETGFQDGNFTFYLVEGNRHDYSYTYDYIYNGLRWFSVNRRFINGI